MTIKHEWHATVTGDPFRWRGFCASIGLEPAWLELNTFEQHLTCGASENPTRWIELAGFPIVRVTHRVASLIAGERAEYHECRVALQGPFQPHAPMASRDLYHERRWFITHRQLRPFDPTEFVTWVRYHSSMHDCIVMGSEYAAVTFDTNPELDHAWTTLVRAVHW